MSRLGAIENAADALDGARIAYEEIKVEFGEVEKAYFELIASDPKSALSSLLKKFGPKLAIFAGLPGGGAILSQPGFLDKVTGLLSGLFGG